MRRLVRLVFWMLVLAGGAAAIYYVTRPEPVAVSLWTVAPGTVEATVANTRAGTVEACRRSKLSPAASGQVAELPIERGDTVVAGQLLLGIWNEDIKAEVSLAQAEAAASRARAVTACVSAEGAEREARRLERLAQTRVVSEEVVDRAVTDARSQRANCQAMQSSVQVAEARLEVARAALERTVLRAPFAGVVAEINAKLGEFVTPSPPGIPTPPAVDLVDLTCLYVTAPIDEVDAPAIRVGMPACVSLDAFKGRRCGGTVRRIAPYVLDREKQARTVEIEVEISDPEDLEGLLPGYSADVEVQLEVRDEVLRIPTEAVLEGYRVLVYRPEDGRLEERRFEPGLANWNHTQVLSGLEAGERIVVSVGRAGVEAGALVAPEPGAGVSER